MFQNSSNMRNVHSGSQDEAVELGLGSLSADEDDLGGEYQRLMDIYNSWRSEERSEKQDLVDVDSAGVSTGLDWDSYRQAMRLRGQILSKDRTPTTDKVQLLKENYEEDFEDIFENAMVISVEDEKMPRYDQQRLSRKVSGSKSRTPETVNGSCAMKEKISRPSSINQRLRRNSLLLGPANKQEILNNICTTVLILVTICAIMFLFWIQNSSHPIGHVEPWPRLRTGDM